MSAKPGTIINLPNALSVLRLLMAPLMIALAAYGQPHWFLAAMLFSGLTDLLDVYLARRLGQVTAFGSHLDSWGDFAIYLAMAIGAVLLWPDTVQRELGWFIAIVASFTLPAIVGLVKFRSFTSYHTWSVKLAVLLTLPGYLLLFAGIDPTLFRIAALVCVYAGIEEIAITLLMYHQHVDVRNIKRAWHYHRRHE